MDRRSFTFATIAALTIGKPSNGETIPTDDWGDLIAYDPDVADVPAASYDFPTGLVLESESKFEALPKYVTGSIQRPEEFRIAALPKTGQQLGNSCAAWSMTNAMEILDARNQGKKGRFARTFDPVYVFNGTKRINGVGCEDTTGLSVSDAAGFIRDYGVRPDKATEACAWTRDDFVANRGMRGDAFSVFRIQGKSSKDKDREDILTAVSQGFPVVVGIDVSEAFKNWWGKSDILEASSVSEEFTGKHGVVVVGYDAESVHVLNSWGWWWGSWGVGRVSHALFNKSLLVAYSVNG